MSLFESVMRYKRLHVCSDCKGFVITSLSEPPAQTLCRSHVNSVMCKFVEVVSPAHVLTDESQALVLVEASKTNINTVRNVEHRLQRRKVVHDLRDVVWELERTSESAREETAFRDLRTAVDGCLVRLDGGR